MQLCVSSRALRVAACLLPVLLCTPKSRSIWATSSYSRFRSSGRNAPYVTPRMYSFRSPAKRNLPRALGRASVRGRVTMGLGGAPKTAKASPLTITAFKTLYDQPQLAGAEQVQESSVLTS